MKLLLSLCLALAGCQSTLYHNGKPIASWPADVTKLSYVNKPLGITFTCDRHSVSTVSRANWVGGVNAISAGLTPWVPAAGVVPVAETLLRP
jgi:hypothetical protein